MGHATVITIALPVVIRIIYGSATSIRRGVATIAKAF
jgi:hypothetical protein